MPFTFLLSEFFLDLHNLFEKKVFSFFIKVEFLKVYKVVKIIGQRDLKCTHNKVGGHS